MEPYSKRTDGTQGETRHNLPPTNHNTPVSTKNLTPLNVQITRAKGTSPPSRSTHSMTLRTKRQHSRRFSQSSTQCVSLYAIHPSPLVAGGTFSLPPVASWCLARCCVCRLWASALGDLLGAFARSLQPQFKASDSSKTTRWCRCYCVYSA